VADCTFGVCDGSGFIPDWESNTDRPCRCRAQRIARARTRSLSRVIPRRFDRVSFDRPPVTDMPRPIVRAVRDYADRIGENLDAGRGLWLMGDVGTGKTTLATLVSKAALDAAHSVAIYSLPDLFRQVRRTYDEGADMSDVELIDRLAEVDLLQLDDVGAERTSEWVLEQLYSIVNARYEAERSIVLTTNISDVDELRAQVGERTVSRLTEMCEQIPVFGTDHRMELRGV
jgi:DNA replication protein DnaC